MTNPEQRRADTNYILRAGGLIYFTAIAAFIVGATTEKFLGTRFAIVVVVEAIAAIIWFGARAILSKRR